MTGSVGQVANLPGQISNLPHDIDFLTLNSRRACTLRLSYESATPTRRTSSPAKLNGKGGHRLTCRPAAGKNGVMGLITLRVLDGADRGKAYADAPTPLTIGREEGNPIQLNDERISRFHLKIQEDQDRIVLTDLQSTNGTKVNGENVQIWMLRPGDVIALGRTVLVFGSREEIAERLAALRGVDLSAGVTLDVDEIGEEEPSSASLDFELNFSDEPDAQRILHTLVPPDLPAGLSPGQTAQLAELLQYVHLRMRGLIQSASVEGQRRRDDARTAAVAECHRPLRPPGDLPPRDRRAERLATRLRTL